MPAVQAKSLLRVIHAVGPYHLVQAGIGRAELLVLPGIAVLEVVRAAKIILCAGTADSRELGISVHKELDLSFAPPAVIIHAPGHVSTHILALAFDTVYQRIAAAFGRVITAELC